MLRQLRLRTWAVCTNQKLRPFQAAAITGSRLFYFGDNLVSRPEKIYFFYAMQYNSGKQQGKIKEQGNLSKGRDAIMLWLSDSACWVIVIVLALVIESISLNLNAVWFAMGGVGSLIAVALGAPVPVQWLVFIVVSAIFLILVRPFARRVLKPKGAATNADRILGEQAVVTQKIDNTLAQGEIKIMGQYWSARSADGAPIAQGSVVRVREIVGVKAIVEPISSETQEMKS